MRSWLSLMLFAAAALAAGSAKAADSRVEALNAAMKCAEIAGDTERLNCYDTAMGRLKEAIEVTPEEQVAAFGKPGESGGGGFSMFGVTLWGKAQTPEQFGAEQVAIARDDVQGLESIRFKISDYAYTPLGLAIIFLENGQVWRQMEGKKIRFPSDPEERYATISTGTLGGYRMTVGDRNASYSVRRIK